MHPVLALKAFFLLSGALILAARLVPALSTRLLTYGARGTDPSSKPDRTNPSPGSVSRSNGRSPDLIDAISSVKVPHSWFTSFYVTITALSSYWILEIFTHGPVFRSLAQAATEHEPNYSMTVPQVFLTWALMSIQGGRRLYESAVLSRPSNSQMWVGHWLLGIAFYVAMSISVWIEGSPALLSLKTFHITDLRLPAPTLRTFLTLPVFLLASGAQNDAHRYLASLRAPSAKKPSTPASAPPVYKLPEHPLFHRIVCPHYTAEGIIYVALAVIAAPEGRWVNGTLTCAMLFAVANLAVTADGAKRWYEARFGEGSVRGKWRMIPFVF
ncbi:MAG: hypothetical protein M1821_006947 [Bathelium mastoideum]|nr:MAG: hypothetical protein M1821_006947 [Bathelium mastoideum]